MLQYTRSRPRGLDRGEANNILADHERFLFISDGRLFLKRDRREPEEVSSKFAKDAMDRTCGSAVGGVEDHRPGAVFTGAQAAWSMAPRTEGMKSGCGRHGPTPRASSSTRFRWTGSAGCSPTTRRRNSSGVCPPEQLHHPRPGPSQCGRPESLSPNRSPNGTANLVSARPTARQKTDHRGDSVDGGPCGPRDGALSFQSAGVGRAPRISDELAPSASTKLDSRGFFPRGEDPGHDCLAPRRPDGAFISSSRPTSRDGQGPNPGASSPT